jgi:uncharacterized protein (TIGR02453 family)
MSDGFNDLIPRAQTFFTALKANNNRDWFNERKAHYTDDIRAPGILFAEIMAEEIARITQVPVTPKVYRLYRDVRFAKDKSPFNAWLHMIWSDAGADESRPWYFFGIDHDAVYLATGVLGLQKDALLRYRRMVDLHGDDLTDVMEATGADVVDFGPEPLKRVPKPYDADHTHADLLRRKGLILQANVRPDHPEGLVRSATDVVKRLLPFHRMLRQYL